MARPSKIDRFIEVAKDVLFRDGLMLLTDEELVFLINENLEEKEKVAQVTFKKWKSGDYSELGETGKEFLSLIKKALIIQKENLFKKFSNDDRAWQRWAWIIERKFSEWNLKNINENKNENTHTGEIKINYNLPNGD
mgnify:FL=1|jgi:hypothetical protein|tara:strand:+ start:2712 stop:3122 length:411 start_codon:yes stop_codon:yes gene_type:complete